MDKVLIRYQGNGWPRYDEKEYVLSVSIQDQKGENIRGPLKINLKVTIKQKLAYGKYLW